MTSEFAASITDFALSAGTFGLGLSIGKIKSYRAWSAFFICMSLASAMGSLFHGFERFHNPSFAAVVATLTGATAFLFLAANFTLAKPGWKWLHWTWPLIGLLGVLVGGALAPMPFYYLSAVSLACIILSIMLLKKATNTTARNWIYFGMLITVAGLGAQKFGNGEGLMSPNSLFHLMQLAGNACFWLGARRT